MSDDPDDQADQLIRLVGTRVRACRKDKGLSQRALSERSGVSSRYIAQLEAGAGNISIGLLQKVASALGISVEVLVAAESAQGVEEARIATLYRQASTATRARVLDVLEPERHRREQAQRVCLIGLRGAGKSTLGPLVAQDIGMPFIELNAEVERSAGIPTSEIFALYGEEGYRQLEAETLSQIIAGNNRVILAVAGGIVSEAKTFEKVITAFHTVWIRAKPEEHMDRVRAQGDMRPMAGNPQAMTQLRQILETREKQYARAELQLDTSGKTVEASRAEMRELLLTQGIVAPARN